MLTLLVDNFVTRRRTVVHLTLWLVYAALAAAEMLLPEDVRVWATETYQKPVIFAGIELMLFICDFHMVYVRA